MINRSKQHSRVRLQELGGGFGGVNSREAESELLKQGCLVEAFLPPDWMKEGYMGVALCPRG